jgi:hypothetical protein
VQLIGARPGPPPFARDAGPLGGDCVVGRAEKITHHLPAQRWVTLQQPLDDRCISVIDLVTVLIRHHHRDVLGEHQHAPAPMEPSRAERQRATETAL